MNFLHKFFAIRPRRELKEMYMFSVLFSFASALILIFEPVFLYVEGFSLSHIALYYALHYSLYAVLIPFGGKFAAKFGYERSLSLSMPLFVLYFLTLALLPQIRELFWVAWVVLTAHKILFWPSYHAAIATFGDGENRGTELAWFYALTRGVGVLGPMVGGIVVTLFGFPTLFIIAAGLALLAAVPLLRTRERFQVRSFSYYAPWRIVFSRQHKHVRRAMYGMGENLVDLVYWPIFMFIIVNGADVLGYIGSLNILVLTLIGFFIGEVSDRVSRRKIVRIHVPFMILAHLLKPLAVTPWRVLLTDSLSKTAFIGIRIPLWFRVYKRGQAVGSLRYSVAVELLLVLSKAATAWVLVGVFAMTLPYTGFIIAFSLAAALTLFYVYL